MKTTIHPFSRKVAFLAVLLATGNVVMAQPSLTTTTTTAGTVRTFGPDAITVTTDSSPTPVRYGFSKTTTYVDENGNPVSAETVISGLPVTVYYNNDGDRLVATKVVVRKHVDMDSDGSTIQKTTTTSTTSSRGLVSSFTPDSMVVTSDTSSAPTTYESTKTTTYVDENGNPVSVETVKSGAPVTVYYDREGDRMVAIRVVVRNTNPDETTVKKTTTTTTETNPNP